ncbi:MAG: electron transfer flavoprotein subunit alpha [Pseudomonadota bacterium]
MIDIIKDKCTGCGECVDICPSGAIVLVEGCAIVKEGECVSCGSCEAMCEAGAIVTQAPVGALRHTPPLCKGVWVVAEQRKGHIMPITHQLLGKGREVADALNTPLSAVVIGCDMREQVESLAGYGADAVFYVNHPDCANFNDELYAGVLVRLIKEHKPEIVLGGATAIGRSYIPAVATLLSTGLTADCIGLEIDKDTQLLLQTRPAYGGQIMATIVCPERRPQMATVRPNVMKKLQFDSNARCIIQEAPYDPSLYTIRTRLVEECEDNENEGMSLSDVDIVVAGGRGMKGKEHCDLLHELAQILGGAAGASRPVVDSGWMQYRQQIGQTGKTVCPKLYIAGGISGAVQHVVGMESSEAIVAINKDRFAPIFDVATYGIAGDLFEVLPVLIKRLKGLTS